MSRSAPQATPLQLHTKADVASLLNVRLSQLTYWFYVLPLDRRYRSFELKRKTSTTPRIIRAPIKPIKTVQANLATALLPYYRTPHTVHGYVPQRSVLTNARIHRRQRWLLRVDLENFFPSINFGRVRGLFLAPPFSFPPPVSTLLAHICCHNNELPQGAPTSPLISNCICRRLDTRLARLAVSERCYYTRYCDDLVFSTNRPSFPHGLATVDSQTGALRAGAALCDAVQANGFRINDAKTVLRKRTQRQVVTGLVTNVFVNVPREYVRSVRTLLYIWRRYGEDSAKACLLQSHSKNKPPGKPTSDFRLVVRGKVQHIGAVKGWGNRVYRVLASRLQALDPTFSPTRRVLDSPPTLLRVLAEGPNDYTHLKTAIKRFQKGREFTDLDLVLERPPDEKGGDGELLKACQTFSKIPHDPPVVCVFDHDNLKIVPQVTTLDAPFKIWGNNVFSIAIPYPAHRDRRQPLCIEMLYTDEVLRRRGNQGRRIYLRSEFDPESARHVEENVYCTNLKAEALIRADDVFDMEGKKVALSKRAFADAIANGRPPYEDVSFEGFRKLFEALREIRMYLLRIP